MKKYLVGLDRDGTIIKDRGYLGKNKNWKEELELYPSVIDGIKLLNTNNNIMLTIASNQAGVALGYFDTRRIEEINREVDILLRKENAIIHNWQYCPYVPCSYFLDKGMSLEQVDNKWIKDETDLRKPGIGMLRKAAKDFGYSIDDFTKIWFIGDKLIDVQTALNVGGVGILVCNGDNRKDKEKVEGLSSIYQNRIILTPDFYSAASFILNDIG